MDRSNNKERHDNILQLIIEYAQGNFSRKIEISEKEDNIDVIANGLQMLGEELSKREDEIAATKARIIEDSLERKYVSKRINEILENVQLVAKGNFNIAFDYSDNNDDFDALAYGVNLMTDEIKGGIEVIEEQNRDLKKSNDEYLALTEKYKVINEKLSKAKKKVEKSGIKLKMQNQELEVRVKERTLELKKQNNELEKAKNRLEKNEAKLIESNITKDKFFFIIAHDLRTPINAMLGFSEMLINDFNAYDTGELKKISGYINESTRTLHNLLENLLLWSRTQQGKVEISPTKEALYLLSEEAKDLLVKPAKGKEIKIVNHISKDLYVMADKNMVLTIFRNLLSNAIKFTNKNGKISLKANIITDENKQNYVNISVIDNGIGIPVKIINKLFKVAENISTNGTEGESGTGLGLILCKEFVEKNGGEIWVNSEADKGSEFIFTLPIVKKITTSNSPV